MGELFACNGHYEAVHGGTIEGCGTVFSPGCGPDDIFADEVKHVIEPTEDEASRGIEEMSMDEVYTFKDHCPVCDLDNVIVVKVGEVALDPVNPV